MTVDVKRDDAAIAARVAARESDNPARVNVLGVGISAVDLDQAAALVDDWVREGRREYVCVTGMHGVMESQKDDSLRNIHNRSGMTTPDGMPMVWLCRLHGRRHVTRVYGPDLMLAVCRDSVVRKRRHFFYGGADGTPEKLKERLTKRFPGLQVVGTHSPPFRPLTPQEDAAEMNSINRARPDIVWVGLSTPKQERWMASHRDAIVAPVLIGVGAAFDFHAGLSKQAPLVYQRSGLEWAYRLCQEPRRLWKRYLINIPIFLTCLLLQAVGLRRRAID